MTPLPKNDGIDHINIYSKGKTEIGRLLTNFAHTSFIYNDLKFESVEAAWYFFGTGQIHHFLRNLHGAKAKIEGRKFPKINLDNFNEIILECIRCKFRQNRSLLLQLANTDLPLAHYYFYGSEDNPKIYYLPQYQWIVDEIDRIRSLTKKWLTKKVLDKHK